MVRAYKTDEKLLCFLKILLVSLPLLGNSVLARKSRETLVSQRIYEPISDGISCFRRMNATHQVGCSSDKGGNVGVLHLLASDADRKWILESGPHAPYVVLLYVESFTSKILGDLQNSNGRVSGVILMKRNDTRTSSYSPDRQCPNQGYGFYNQSRDPNFCLKWNEPGSEILYQDWSFPVFYVSSNKSTSDLLNCYRAYNQPGMDGSPREWPLCSAQLESFMTAAVDTPTCIRRNKLNEFSVSPSLVCDPLGDANVWSTLVTSNQTKPHPKRSVIVIAARLDASSMFDQYAPGADAAATGITAILALVKQLSPLKEELQNSANVSNIYFMLFNGEAFDYIGSSRVVYDMTNDKFPYEIQPDEEGRFPALLHLDDIMFYIELNQLALYSSPHSYYVHMNWNSTEFRNNGFKLLIEKFERKRFGKPINVADDNIGVPPSSLQTFLAKDSDFPGVVITNHNHEYTNEFYNSIFDDSENILYDDESSHTVRGISELVATIAATVEELVIGEKRPFTAIKPEPKLIDEILQCYVKSPTCSLFQNVTNDDASALSKITYNYYVGVNRRINVLTTITQYIMGLYQGTIVNRTEEECERKEFDSEVYEYMWISGRCYETTATATPAESPAFDDVDSYDWESGLYSSWTESVWSDLRVRIFLQPSKTHEIITLVSGIIIFLASIVLFSWINAHADEIFKPRYIGYTPVPPH